MQTLKKHFSEKAHTCPHTQDTHTESARAVQRASNSLITASLCDCGSPNTSMYRNTVFPPCARYYVTLLHTRVPLRSTMSNKMSVSSLLLLLSFLVEVHSQQTFPYVSFGQTGQALADHSYVDLSTVGSELDNSDSVVCHSDLGTCCSGSQGQHRGNWSFPDGTVLPFAGSSVPIGLGRNAQIAIIRRSNDATGPTGIYRCDIPTNAVHNDTDESLGETVYVGLYLANGGKLRHRLAADINLSIVLV